MTERIQELISKPMSDADLEQYPGITPGDIIKYSELKTFATIEDFLPGDKSFRIVLIEQKYNSGHWVAVMRYGNTIEYFNSYGSKWDTDWEFVPRMVRAVLGEASNEMSRLMASCPAEFHCIWNPTKFQKMASWVQTCGKWCVLRVEMMRLGYDLSAFTAFIRKQTKKHPADFVVSELIQN